MAENKTYARKRDSDKEQEWINQLVAQAQLRGFYGKLTIVFEAGIVRRVTKEESLVPPT